MNINQLIQSLSSLSSQPLALVGIDGRPGSGKTPLVAQLEQSLTFQTIYLDEFFIPQREWPHDQSPRFPFFYFRYEEFINGIKTVAAGKPFTYHPYDWQADASSISPITIEPKGIIIVEGVSALNAELTPLYHTKIWVKSDRTTELAALQKRENGNNWDLWNKIYLPSIEIYCLQTPWKRADIIYKGRGIVETPMDINVVKALIFHKIDDTVQLLILKRSNHAKKFPDFEDLSGGKVDTTENIFSALAREIQEETQLEVDHIKLLTSHVWPEIDNPNIQYKEYLFCTHAVSYQVKLNPLEHSSFRWITLDQINKTSLHPSMKKIILEHKDKIFDYIKNI